MLCSAGYGYAGIHARSNYDLDAIGAICQPATSITRVQSVGKKPIPQGPAIRNPADSTTVLSRSTGPTLVQQSAAADAALPTRDRQAHTVVNAATGDIAGRIEANQMICRGGQSLGVHRQGPSTASSSPADTWTLYFTPAQGPAKSDASGLEPGQCGYVDRGWTAGDPPGILFDVAAGAAGSPTPAQYLSDPTHYWSFVVAYNGRGMFAATRHGKYRDSAPTATTVERPRCDTAVVSMRNDLDGRIDRIRCENAGLTPNQRAQLNAKLDEVLQWLAMAR